MGEAAITFGEGSSLSLGGGCIPGGQTISADSFFRTDPSLQVKREVWVGFLFNNEIDVLGLLVHIQKNIPLIVSQIYKILDF